MCDDPYATHLPVLREIGAMRPIRRVLEFGAGMYSTPLFLDRTAYPDLEVLVSVEDDWEWLQRIKAERNGGKGSAIRRGLERAQGTVIAIQDADLELDPQQLAVLVQPIVDGDTDVVFGSRFIRGGVSIHYLEQKLAQEQKKKK